MCWRDDIVTRRRCIMCGGHYYGDLGHRNCPSRRPPGEREYASWFPIQPRTLGVPATPGETPMPAHADGAARTPD